MPAIGSSAERTVDGGQTDNGSRTEDGTAANSSGIQAPLLAGNITILETINLSAQSRRPGLVWLTGHFFGLSPYGHLALEFRRSYAVAAATLSGEEQNGRLVSIPNRPTDQPIHNTAIALVIPPPGVSPSDFWESLQSLDTRYTDDWN